MIRPKVGPVLKALRAELQEFKQKSPCKACRGSELSSAVLRKANEDDEPTNVIANHTKGCGVELEIDEGVESGRSGKREGQKMCEPHSKEVFYCRLRSTFLISRRKLGI